MNFVVGVILIGMVDPQGYGFGSDEAQKKTILQFAMTYDFFKKTKHYFKIYGGYHSFTCSWSLKED